MTMNTAIRDLTRTLEYVFREPNKQVCSKCDRCAEYCEMSNEHHRGCCHDCAIVYGYYRVSLDGMQGKTAAKHLRRYWWDEVYGFFNPVEMRCNLPREYRSVVCLAYTCGDVDKTLSAETRDTIQRIVDVIQQYRTRNVGWLKEMLRSVQA